VRPQVLQGPVVLVFLVGLAVGSWWLANRGRDADAPTSTSRVGQPGYYLKDATLEQTDETGRIELRVHAADAVQDPVTRNVQADTLRVDYLLDAPRTWVMTARSGTLPPDGRKVFLAGDVILTGRTGTATPPAVVHTEHMQLDVDASIATTKDPVRIEMGPQSIRARGLRADLKADRLRLESNVNGRYTR
jgi:lipopolysaccharide export system protein LptC